MGVPHIIKVEGGEEKMIVCADEKLKWKWEKDTTWEAFNDIEFRHDWNFGNDGPFLGTELENCFDFVMDGISSDLDKLQKLGARGTVIFTDTYRSDPYVKVTLSDKGVSWTTPSPKGFIPIRVGIVYSVYVNHPNDKAKLHKRTCVFVQKRKPNTQRGQWQDFATRASAVAFVKRTGKLNTQPCQVCRP